MHTLTDPVTVEAQNRVKSKVEPMFRFGFPDRVVPDDPPRAADGASPSNRMPQARVPHDGGTGSASSGPQSKDVVYRRLFDTYWPRVHRHLECFLENAEEVDELTAEVFVVAWRKLSPANPLPFSWFLRTADNKLRDRTRRAESQRRVVEALSRGMTASTAGVDPLEALAIRRALTTLNARERQVVVLTYWDDLTAGEVAEVLRTSQSAVWTTLTRARTKLRIQLDGEDGHAPRR